jgi:hypothetical protein
MFIYLLNLFYILYIIYYMSLKIKCLAVLLFHDDEDIIEDQINYYKYINYHDLIVFNHNSNDNTSKIINKFKKDILCIYDLSKNINFKKNKVHESIYNILLGKNICEKNNDIQLSNHSYYNYNYSQEYDWISFPESDEFLEGPNRSNTYYEHLYSIHNDNNIDKIKFDNIIYWFTKNDDLRIKSPNKRIKYYCYKSNCGIRLYAWRGTETIIRFFGHASIKESMKKVATWKTRHYEIRSSDHFIKKITDRLHIADGNTNDHYKSMYYMYHNQEYYGIIKPEELHYDNGVDEINMQEIFNWSKIY